MTRRLESFVAGRWIAPPDDGTPVRDAATGEVVALVSSSGVDTQAALAHARTVGVPALQELTFHERSLIVKSVATAVEVAKQELYELSAHTGATPADSAMDVDGGISTALALASKGRRELPNAQLLIDGPPEMLSKRGTFVGQHVYVPRQGAALLINAFNFPVWGMLEKLGPALIAGTPVIVKPATPTAYVAELAVRRIVDAEVLPPGALQLICGSIGSLFDRLDGQDTVAFTGSASTAAVLRSHRAFTEWSARFTAEADSLNFSMLGPDARPGTPEYDLFVNEIVREMTIKAGQRCTAIRRALVPGEAAGAVAESLADRLSSIRIGNPRDESVDMGPLVSLEQRDEVQAAIEKLAAAGEVSFQGDALVRDLDCRRGAYQPPTVVTATGDHSAVHDVEAFGPVATLIGYTSVEEAIAIANRGGGSLAGSIFTADPDVGRRVALGVAAQHGRLLIMNADAAPDSAGHGTPLAHLVHGGPGRAGGGEELGGMRSVRHYMQRTALQGSPDMLTAVTGHWTTGSKRVAASTHPFRKCLEDLQIGDSVVAGPRLVTREDIAAFASLTGDTFYAHTDEDAARENPLFGGLVAHGYFVVSAAAGLFVDPAPGPVLANYGLENLRFLVPVKPDDEITVKFTCKEKSPRVTEPYGEVRWDVEVVNQDANPVATYDVLTLVAKRDGNR